MAEKWLDLFSWLFGKEAKAEVKEMDNRHEKERSGFLWELFESALARWTPWFSKFLDMMSSVWLKKKDPEAVRRQNEFEWFTAWSILIPDRFLRYVTDPIVKIPYFAEFVKKYPWANSFEKKLLDKNGNVKDKYDPDDVISFIRMIHQDFISGKVWVDKVINK